MKELALRRIHGGAATGEAPMGLAGRGLAILILAAVTSVCTGAEVATTRNNLERIRQKLDTDDTYDLDAVAAALPQWFASPSATEAFFSSPIELTLHDPHIYLHDLKLLTRSLAAHAGRAARKGDWDRARVALALILDVCIRPTSLTPPQELNRMPFGIRYIRPGTTGYMWVILTGVEGMEPFRDTLRTIANQSPEHAKCLRTLLARLSALDAKEKQFDQRQMAFTPEEAGIRKESVSLYLEETALIRDELSRLRPELAESLKCLQALP